MLFLFTISATVYCGIDKESNRAPGEELVLLLLPVTHERPMEHQTWKKKSRWWASTLMNVPTYLH
jgi:hypothetical protein